MSDDDSRIVTGAGGTTFVGEDATRLFAAATLRAALGLLRHGIQPTRGYTMRRALAAASLYTRKSYAGRRDIERARADLKIWCDEMAAALPKEGEGA